MPKQHVCCGRPLPRFGSRRISLVLTAVALLFFMSLLVTLESGIYTDASYEKYMEQVKKLPKIPELPELPDIKLPFSDSILNPFRPPSHPPPRHEGDSYGDSAWWADWKWLHVPFSSSMTLDEDRSLLPPLRERPPIYCYYDTTIKKDAPTKDAESDLLLTWRRAWWAHGFKPIILSASEATSNPLYKQLQRYPDMGDGLKTDLMRWLAWEHMGGGLLAHHTTLPMGPREDPLLSSLRRAEYPKLTRWAGLEDGLFAGVKEDIYGALVDTLEGPRITKAWDLLSAMPQALIAVDDKPKAIAYYDTRAIEGRYSKVAQAIDKDGAEGLRSLNSLINGHLHQAWHGSFAEGIAVLKPQPRRSTHLVADAWRLAHDLAACPDTPMPNSCPPNGDGCRRCSRDGPVPVTTPDRYRNTSALYTVATVPHPVTTTMLSALRKDIDIAWVRRKSPRDPWLAAVTSELVDDAHGQSPRVLRLKEAVAGDAEAARSVWLAAQHHPVDDWMRAQLEWHVGFAVPRPAGGGDVPPQPALDDDEEPTKEEMDKEPAVLEHARNIVFAGHEGAEGEEEGMVALRSAVEAWNLADTETWKFARAFLDRRILERKTWEEEESRYASGSGSEQGRKKGWRERWGDEDEKKG